MNHRTPIRFSGSLMTATALFASTLLMAEAAAPRQWLTLSHWGHTSQALAQDAEESVNIRVYSAASAAVVSIETPSGNGSGSIISADGLILTNAHVVNDVETVTVVLSDGRRLEGDVVAFGEAGLDLAAVRIPNQRDLPVIELAAADSIQVGQRAFAIGNPFGRFQGTFTTGIVSRIDTNRGLLQTDAAINPGNSGGPLLNSQGQMIGVNSAIFSPRGRSGNTGIGFAISMNRVAPFLTAVREGRAPRVAQQSPMLGGGEKAAQRIRLNANPVEGSLADDSNVLPSDGSYFNAYTFEGQAGQRVIIEMNSDELNPYLILLQPDGTDLAQDGGSGSTNARVVTVLPDGGLYTILANSRNAGETGRYMLRAIAPDPSNAAATPSTVVLEERSSLGPQSERWPEDGSPYQDFMFEGEAGQVISISMESSEFETYLMLFGEDGSLVDRSSIPTPERPNSSILVSLPTSGSYRIVANAYRPSGRGSFQLTIRQEE
ncbi:MAG: trypsin-like peptidase domain-containing protein [Kaiparowitsia implicata GSE-PSE-MK54-09C]|jgi:serine protease Do|nr:trypsin-like peptidase domain-containing protein [Kaiparowitsia implicata GSE-PSE-MK54-09C]